jgi:N-acetylglucosaminyl-diphospho-decaprenol L-rhamnosyltransferase
MGISLATARVSFFPLTREYSQRGRDPSGSPPADDRASWPLLCASSRLASDIIALMQVDVIIVTYDSVRQVPMCLGPLVDNDRVSEIVVVDNGSVDGSAEAARQSGASIVVVNEANLGFARAVNIGLRSTSAELVLLLNPDASVDADTLGLLSRDLEADPSVAMVGPLLRDETGALSAGAARAATLSRRIGECVPLIGRVSGVQAEYTLPRDPGVLGKAIDVGYVYGAAMLVDRRFFLECGGLDERFFLFAEDEDLCRQARRSGRRVLLDGRALAEHARGANCPSVPLTEAQRLFSSWRLFQKWAGRARAAAYHYGIRAAFSLRAAAALDPGVRADIILAACLFDEAVRTNTDPLVRVGAGVGRAAPEQTTAMRRP